MDLNDAMAMLKANYHCVIATTTLDGRPWVSPVFFNYDASLRIVFESARDSHHAQLIAANPRIAIVVADFAHRGAPAGVYLECTAREVPIEEIDGALAVFLDGPHEKSLERSAADYGADKPLGLYEARPYHLYGLTQVTTEDGYVIDTRIEIALPA